MLQRFFIIRSKKKKNLNSNYLAVKYLVGINYKANLP